MPGGSAIGPWVAAILAGRLWRMTKSKPLQGNEPRVIYGTMGLGGSWSDPTFGSEQIDQAHAALSAAAEAGVRVIDTADIYRVGSSEQIVGEVLRRDARLRECFTVQTKVGIIARVKPGDITRYNLSGGYIRAAIDASLERLGGVPIDTLLLHRPDPLAHPEDTGAAIAEAMSDGKILRWGVSNMSPRQIKPLAAILGVPAVNQLELSLSARGFVENTINVPFEGQPGSNYAVGTVAYSADHGSEVQAWSPLSRGRYLTASSEQLGFNLTQADRDTREYVRELADKYQTTGESVLLWWLTAHPAGIRPVVGTSTPERILACRDANLQDSPLTRDEWYTLLTRARGESCP